MESGAHWSMTGSEQNIVHMGVNAGNAQTLSAILSGMDADKEVMDHRARYNTTSQTALHRASVAGNGAMVRQLLANNASVNAKDSKRDSPLHVAIEHGRWEVAAHLAMEGANIMIQGSQGLNAIHLAAWHGQYQLIPFLMRKGANVNGFDGYGRTPLHASILANHLHTLNTLLTYGADANMVLAGPPPMTPLHCAARLNRASLIAPLILRGANLNAQTTRLGPTPLMVSAQNGSHDTMIALLKGGAAVPCASPLQHPALVASLEKAHAERGRYAYSALLDIVKNKRNVRVASQPVPVMHPNGFAARAPLRTWQQEPIARQERTGLETPYAKRLRREPPSLEVDMKNVLPRPSHTNVAEPLAPPLGWGPFVEGREHVREAENTDAEAGTSTCGGKKIQVTVTETIVEPLKPAFAILFLTVKNIRRLCDLF